MHEAVYTMKELHSTTWRILPSYVTFIPSII